MKVEKPAKDEADIKPALIGDSEVAVDENCEGSNGVADTEQFLEQDGCISDSVSTDVQETSDSNSVKLPPQRKRTRQRKSGSSLGLKVVVIMKLTDKNYEIMENHSLKP